MISQNKNASQAITRTILLIWILVKKTPPRLRAGVFLQRQDLFNNKGKGHLTSYRVLPGW